tara:strand:- start:461 stop:604 length:144 start_codon:yes stop_codon:yes gene_type:complete
LNNPTGSPVQWTTATNNNEDKMSVVVILAWAMAIASCVALPVVVIYE